MDPFKFFKSLAMFILSTVIDRKEWDVNHEDFNPKKIIVVLGTLLILYILGNATVAFVRLEDWLDKYHPAISKEYDLYKKLKKEDKP